MCISVLRDEFIFVLSCGGGSLYILWFLLVFAKCFDLYCYSTVGNNDDDNDGRDADDDEDDDDDDDDDGLQALTWF